MKKVIEGIVFQKTNYSESSLIVKLLTADSGIQSFIFKGGRSKGKKGNILSPLSIVSVEYYGRNESDLPNISSLELAFVFKNIPFDPGKSAILFFMNEVLLNAVHDREDSADVYDFVLDTLKNLDAAEQVANFPVKFLVDMMQHLGFFPNASHVGGYFDLKEATYVSSAPAHDLYMSREKSSAIIMLSKMKLNQIHELKIAPDIRKEMIRNLLSYFHIVLDKWREIRSLPVLEATLHD